MQHGIVGLIVVVDLIVVVGGGGELFAVDDVIAATG